MHCIVCLTYAIPSDQNSLPLSPICLANFNYVSTLSLDLTHGGEAFCNTNTSHHYADPQKAPLHLLAPWFLLCTFSFIWFLLHSSFCTIIYLCIALDFELLEGKDCLILLPQQFPAQASIIKKIQMMSCEICLFLEVNYIPSPPNLIHAYSSIYKAVFSFRILKSSQATISMNPESWKIFLWFT